MFNKDIVKLMPISARQDQFRCQIEQIQKNNLLNEIR